MTKTKNKTLTSYIKDFLNYLTKEKNRTKATVKNYDFYLKRFFKYAKITKAGEITPEKIKNYKAYLIKKALKASTINYHLIALRALLKYLKSKKIKTILPESVILTRTISSSTTTLTKLEMNKLLETPTNSKEKEIIKLRDKAILETLHATDLKVSELISMQGIKILSFS